ncbi:hypothetical protein AC629_16015 [Bradyrhizobium sp. NAS80.1]|nr:hypothetical protein AC629_16015 [Bradyrhizobium sp. NAS80.1]
MVWRQATAAREALREEHLLTQPLDRPRAARLLPETPDATDDALTELATSVITLEAEDEYRTAV